MTPPNLEEFFKKFNDNLPAGLKEIQQDIEKNTTLGVESILRNMNLITREEFDVQTGVLQRTRARLEELEAKVAMLEAKLEGKEVPDTIIPPAPNSTAKD